MSHLSSNFVSDTLAHLVERELRAISISLLFIVSNALGTCIIAHMYCSQYKYIV